MDAGLARHFAMRAVAFREGDAWVVQGLEYDIAAFARDVADAPDAFMRVVVETLCICEQLGREPFQGVRPAPPRFKALWEGARSTLRPVEPAQAGPDLDIRLAAA